MKENDLKQKVPFSVNIQMTVKVVVIIFAAIGLLIPRFMILDLIKERSETAELTKLEVMKNWSENQIVRGPVLVIPYHTRNYISNLHDGEREEIGYCYFLPENLNVSGNLSPEKLKKSIYKTVVYDSKLSLSGVFEELNLEELKIPAEDIIWEKSKILLAINDLHGIKNQISINWNGQTLPFSPGMGDKNIGNRGISLSLPNLSVTDFPARFNFDLSLKGSESLEFAPVGKTTEVNLKSVWNDPGFQGEYLPVKRDISKDGFTADWKVLHFNRNFPQAWKGNEYKVTENDFGVKLVSVADHYQKSSRTAKYAILVIVLTFLSFFLSEIILKQKIHPFQYILIGFAILIFYLLLLSISEQLGFDTAYLVSSIAVLTMVLLYSKTFLAKWAHSAILTSIVAFSFGFIYVLLQLETFSLLAGSVGLFFILALTMYFTRKINWYNY